MKRQQGFTLIELMIVVGIIGILSSIAVLAYQDYTRRAYVAEALTLISPVKSAIIEHYATTGQLPIWTQDIPEYANGIQNNNHALWVPGLKSSSAMGMSGVSITRTGIYIYFSNTFQGIDSKWNENFDRELPIIPVVEDGSITFYCGIQAMKKVGLGFTGNKVSTIPGKNDIESRYLPSICR